ncbi:MAG: anti-sigma regulatory factor, partial [Nitrospirales bacterium]|nr:anti-sigma regulatory factor [Nitrospirales bacterium]
DVIIARQIVRKAADEIGMRMLDETRLVTAVSELARNIVVHAGDGIVSVYLARADQRQGIKVVFADKGPGMMDIEQAMEEGFSTVGSLGLGLKGASRLVDDFHIQSAPGQGTTVEITQWLPE